jgi:ATP-dependent helicase Lhr and Lhr-like helicase
MSEKRDLSPLPTRFTAWFQSRGWAAHDHQLAVLRAVQAGRSALLIAPTGGGKTLAGFLPSLVELAEADPTAKRTGIHTLYISPLKALTVDVARNLETPIREMGLAIESETRTGDTPQNRRQRQRKHPPHIMLTTPESLALLLSYTEAPEYFASLRTVIIDELHALADTKRGQLLALGLARVARLAPECRFLGLSATVAAPERVAQHLQYGDRKLEIIRGRDGAAPEIGIVIPDARVPWSGRMALHAVPAVYEEIKRHRTTLVFVNTRAQSELVFQALWRLNDDNLAIALHHGSLAVEQRRKVEAAMARGTLRAVVATSSLDLGIDWGDIDLVIQVGAPKGASRLLQRIGRANHRLDEPSRALLVPANRFEVLECKAAIDAAMAKDLDEYPPRPYCLDVLAQHILCLACAGSVDPDTLYAEVITAAPYAPLPREEFDQVFGFVRDGGYALKAYDRWKRLRQMPDGGWRAANPTIVRQYRMNVGTIVESPMLKVRLGRGQMLGEVEEWFVQGLLPGDTFQFAGRLLRFEGIREMSVVCSLAKSGEPKVPVYGGGRLPLTTGLAERVRAILADRRQQADLPEDVQEWLRLQRWRSVLPGPDGLLIESFPRGNKEFLVAYCFEGRIAHQTLGMLLTRRMERLGLKPLGFVATDYVLATWSLFAPTQEQIELLFGEDMLGDDLEEWLDDSSMLRRSFRNVAVVAGLIERRHPGEEKTRRQVTFNADLIYDVLRKHEPDHILLRATRQDAAWNLADVQRLGDFLKRVQGSIDLKRLDRVTPLAVPVLVTLGSTEVGNEAMDALLEEAAADLIEEATSPRPGQVAML